MAWTQKLANGRYYGCYRAGRTKDKIRDTFGKPLQFSRESEALRKAGAKEDELRQPGAVLPGAGRITWGEWCDTWWAKHVRTIEPNSRSSQESYLRKHIKPRWKDEPLAGIERAVIQDWVDGLGLGANTTIFVYQLFASSVRAAVGVAIDASPCVKIDLPTPPPAEIHFLTSEEFDKLLSFLAKEWRILALLLVDTGMRWGEAVALHWQDVHPKTVSINCAYSRKGREIKPYPKDEEARTVPLLDRLGRELAEWRPDDLPTRCGARHRIAGRCRSGLVVPGPSGVWAYDSCAARIRGAAALAKLGRVTMHDLRDTYASWVLQKGFPIEQVAELLGHSDIKLTRQRYAQFGSSQFDAIRAAMSAPVLPQSPTSNIISMDSRRRSGT